MKIFPKQSKAERKSEDFYFGNYGEISLGISSITLNKNEMIDDKLHYHKNGTEFYLTTEGQGLLEIEGEEIILTKEKLVMVEPGEKHRIKGSLKTPFSFIVICTVKDEKDKINIEQ